MADNTRDCIHWTKATTALSEGKQWQRALGDGFLQSLKSILLWLAPWNFGGCTSLAASSTPIVKISAGFYQKARWYLWNSLKCSGNEFRHHCARARSPLVGWFFVWIFGAVSQQCKCTVLTTFSKRNTVAFWNCWVIILGLKKVRNSWHLSFSKNAASVEFE